MKMSEITKRLEDYFPLHHADDWDHCGLQIGDLNRDVHHIMVALTPDEAVIDECIEKDIDLLITHHPLFFSPFNTIDFSVPEGRIIQKIIDHHITVYSLHTCMDRGEKESMNQWLMEELQIKNYQRYEKEPLISIAYENISLKELIDRVKESFDLPYVKYVGILDQEVSSFAIVGGSGCSFLSLLENDIQCLITGDIKYHDAQWAFQHGVALIDVGHFVEHIMTKKTKAILECEFSITVYESRQKDYLNYR